MKGKVLITCDEHGTHISTDLIDVAEHDTTFLVHALGKSLGLTYEDYVVLSIAEAGSVLDAAATPTFVTIDADELRKQMEEEKQDAC